MEIDIRRKPSKTVTRSDLRPLVIVILLAALCISSCQIKSTAVKDENVSKQTYRSVGIVKLVDIQAGKITIDHEDIPGYMPAMEMNESVISATLLDKVRSGDKVTFEIERTGSQLVITKLTKFGEVVLPDSREIYRTNCSECHGSNGEGAKKGISLVSGHALHHSDAEYIEQVSNGEGKKMPAFKDKLNKLEISAVVTFVRTEIQRDARREQPVDHQRQH